MGHAIWISHSNIFVIIKHNTKCFPFILFVKIFLVCSSVQFSCSVVSDPLQPHGLQHARLSFTSLTPRVYSNTCPSSQWCHLTLSSCHPLLLLPSIFPRIRVFSNESTLRMRWSKYQSFNFNISPSKEHPGLYNGLVGSPCSPRDSQESSPTP